MIDDCGGHMTNQRKQRTAGSTGNGEQLFRHVCAREQLAA
jgi:hypothetical protein